MRLLFKILLPVVVIAISIGIAQQLITHKPQPERRARPAPLPTVEALRLQSQDYQIYLKTQGTVRPRTETTLIPEVAGRVVDVSPHFREGGFFEKNETLLQIDPRDYEIAVTVADAQVAQAQSTLEQEKAQAQVAENEIRRSQRKPTSMALALREPQLAAARAALESAQAQLARAQLDLQRTRINAPYAGRLLEKNVDVGQYVSGGTVLARIYAIDYVEIPLPLSNEQLQYVDIPEQFRPQETAIKMSAKPAEPASSSGPTVTLSSRIAGNVYQWQGQIVRATGSIDTSSRQLFVIAQVDDPYGRGPADRPPLRIGQFVEAQITGTLLNDVFVVPRSALSEGRELLVIDAGERLQRREVEIIWADQHQVVIRTGLQAGEIISMTPLPGAISGSRVAATIAGEGNREPQPEPGEFANRLANDRTRDQQPPAQETQ
jgi:RND family efflux transporter MFP subunit